MSIPGDHSAKFFKIGHRYVAIDHIIRVRSGEGPSAKGGVATIVKVNLVDGEEINIGGKAAGPFLAYMDGLSHDLFEGNEADPDA